MFNLEFIDFQLEKPEIVSDVSIYKLGRSPSSLDISLVTTDLEFTDCFADYLECERPKNEKFDTYSNSCPRRIPNKRS